MIGMKKRFISNYDGSEIIDTKTMMAYAVHSGSEEPIIELLNELNDELLLLECKVGHYELLWESLKKEAKRFCEIKKAGDVE